MLSLIALLGRKDTPTDGVEDYCTFLGRALGQRGVTLKQFRVDWVNKGWIGALRQLRRESKAWRGNWILLQYTALGWSRRGFPLGAVATLWFLRRRGVRCAVVFHEPYRQWQDSRWIDRVRGACQGWVIRRLYGGSAKGIFADPLETVRWLPKDHAKAAFIPIGANIPEPERSAEVSGARNGAAKTVAVFCLSDPPNRELEVGDIASAMRSASTNGSKLQVIFLGRGTAEAQQEIDRAFDGIPVQVSNFGLRSAEEVSRTLSGSDAMLCVRGSLYPRRGSALAGIACGLPIVGYAGAAERTHLAEAGVELVPYCDREALGAALSRVLTDEGLHAELRSRNRRVLEKYFSWGEIAKRYSEALGSGSGTAMDAR